LNLADWTRRELREHPEFSYRSRGLGPRGRLVPRSRRGQRRAVRLGTPSFYDARPLLAMGFGHRRLACCGLPGGAPPREGAREASTGPPPRLAPPPRLRAGGPRTEHVRRSIQIPCFGSVLGPPAYGWDGGLRGAGRPGVPAALGSGPREGGAGSRFGAPRGAGEGRDFSPAPRTGSGPREGPFRFGRRTRGRDREALKRRFGGRGSRKPLGRCLRAMAEVQGWAGPNAFGREGLARDPAAPPASFRRPIGGAKAGLGLLTRSFSCGQRGRARERWARGRAVPWRSFDIRATPRG